MKNMIIFLLFTLLSASLISQEADPKLRSVEIRLIQKDIVESQKLTIGDEITVQLEISEALPIFFFKNLVEGKFLFENSIFLSHVKEVVSIKEGYANSYEGRASFIGPVIPKAHYEIPVNVLGMNLHFININLEIFNDDEIKNAAVPALLEQNFAHSVDKRWIFVFVFIIMLILGFILRKHFLKKKKREEQEKLERYWLSTIANAKNRNEIEELYKNETIWSEVLGVDRSLVYRFHDVVNLHQYKKEWDDEIWLEVKKVWTNLCKEKV